MIMKALGVALALSGGISPSFSQCLETRLLDPFPEPAYLYKIRIFTPDNIVVIGQLAVISTQDTGRTWTTLDVKPMKLGISYGPDGFWNERTGGRYFSSTFLDDSTAVLAGDGGILNVTQDAGASWRSHAAGLGEIISVQPSPGGGLYVENTDRVMHRTNLSGELVRRLYQGKPGITVQFDDSTSINVDYESRFHSEISGCRMARTGDGGQTWEGIGTGLQKFCWLERQSDTSAFLLSRERNYVTRDKGKSWRELTEDFKLPTGSGLYRMKGRLEITYLDSLNGFRGGEGGNLSRTMDGGRSWKGILPTAHFPGGLLSAVGLLDGEGYALTGPSTSRLLAHTRDRGADWSLESGPSDSGLKSDFNRLTRIALRKGGGLGGVGPEGLLLVRRDSAAPWERISLETKAALTSIQFVGDSTGFVLGKTEPGTLNLPITFLKTVDGGKTWTSLPIPFKSDPLASDFVSPLEGYLQYGGNIHRTSDGGLTWKLLSPELLTAVRDFKFRKGGRGLILMGQNDLYETRNGGDTWERNYTVLTPLDNRVDRILYLDEERIAIRGWHSDSKLVVSKDDGKTWSLQDSEPLRNGIQFVGRAAIAYGTNGALYSINLDRCFEYTPMSLRRLDQSRPAGAWSPAFPGPSLWFRAGNGKLLDALGRHGPPE